jgi:hypothetical protein
VLRWRRLGPGGAYLWAQVALPCLVAPMVHVCHHFGLFLPYFLHTNNSTSTSGTRWNLNIILHMWWWFSCFWVKCWWSKWVLVTVNKLPHTEPLLVPSKGFEQEKELSKDSGEFDTQLS